MHVPLYPLRFEPIYKSALWGGRRLGELLEQPLPGDDPIGEAWVLSDQGHNCSRIAEGPLQGRTLRELLESDADRILGRDENRFPLLLKFIDARQALSVQVHPDDRHTHLLPPGERGKTEAWMVLDAEPGSQIYAGLKPGVGPKELREALRSGTAADCLHAFEPRPGDCLFIPAGTIHALGAGLVIFEVQQSSNVTFRLYDWDRVDARTGQPRQLHIEASLECIDFELGPRQPVVAHSQPMAPGLREELVSCAHFTLDRLHGSESFLIGGAASCRILVGITGQAELEHDGATYPIRKGDVMLLPAEVGTCRCRPIGTATLLECSLPE